MQPCFMLNYQPCRRLRRGNDALCLRVFDHTFYEAQNNYEYLTRVLRMITELSEEKKEPVGGPGGHSHGMEGMY